MVSLRIVELADHTTGRFTAPGAAKTHGRTLNATTNSADFNGMAGISLLKMPVGTLLFAHANKLRAAGILK
jgi:hypothetical protein